MKAYRQNLGSWGEREAAAYLMNQGYAILDRNVRTPYGEIDLIGLAPDPGSLDSQVLIFIEVKTRRSTSFGLPESAITSRKKAHLLAAIQAYIQEHPGLPGIWRIDVISIQRSEADDLPVITHFENAFS